MLKDHVRWAAIRKAVLDEGVSRRQICRETGLHWRTIHRILSHEVPPGYKKRQLILSQPDAQSKTLATQVLKISVDKIIRGDPLLGWTERRTPNQVQAMLQNDYGVDIDLDAVSKIIDNRRCCRDFIWEEVSELLCQVTGCDSTEIIKSLIPIDPRRQPIGRLRRLRRLLKARCEAFPVATIKADSQDPSAWLFRLLLGRETLSAVGAAVGDSPDLPVLYRAVRDGKSKHRTKALTILACKKGISLRRIARTLQFSNIGALSRYWKLYQEGGAERLFSRQVRPSPKVADESIRNCVFEVLHAPPSVYGINRTSWKMDDIVAALLQRGVSIHPESIRKIIKKAGYRWIKARTVLTSNDPQYREKLERITGILSRLRDSERFFSIDEFGPFAVKMRPGRLLAGPRDFPSVPQFQKSKGYLILTAALELSTNHVTHFYSSKKNTGEMLELLDLLLSEYAGCETLYLSWDAALWHVSKALKARVDEVNNSANGDSIHGPRVELVPLPSRAQYLNVIESVFSGMAKAIIHNSDYQSVDEAKAAIDRYYVERNQHFLASPKRAGQKIWGSEICRSEFSEANNCKDPTWCRER